MGLAMKGKGIITGWRYDPHKTYITYHFDFEITSEFLNGNDDDRRAMIVDAWCADRTLCHDAIDAIDHAEAKPFLSFSLQTIAI